jgi:RNA polymerase sigma-70 factor, ECF subfamily
VSLITLAAVKAVGADADFSALVTAYADDLFRYARWLCRDPHRAEDLVQETLLRCWRGFAGLREVSTTKTWLITTLRREFFRDIGSSAHKASSISLDDDEAPMANADIPSHVPDLDHQIDIERALNRLSDVHREVLVLQLYFGYTTDEMAKLLNTSETAISNRLLRARKALTQTCHPVAKDNVVPLSRSTSWTANKHDAQS